MTHQGIPSLTIFPVYCDSPECPKPVNILAIALGVTGGILLVGLILLLIGKAIVSIHDHREYVKFENEKRKAQWDKVKNEGIWGLYKIVAELANHLIKLFDKCMPHIFHN